MPPKDVWKKIWENHKGEFFPLHRYPEITDFTSAHILNAELIVLLGGGQTELWRYLGGDPQIAFVNIDIAAPTKHIHTINADMEDRDWLDQLRKSTRPLGVIAPFSLEYNDVNLVTSHTADLLEAGERFVWISHHSDSYIVEDFRKLTLLIEILEQLFDKLNSAHSTRWPLFIEETENKLDMLYSREKTTRLRELSADQIRSMQRERHVLRGCFENISDRETNVDILLENLMLVHYQRIVAEGMGAVLGTLLEREGMLQKFETLLEEFGLFRDVSTPLLEKSLCDPLEITRMCNRLKLVQARVVNDKDQKPLAILLAMEKVIGEP